ncbi:hypothetical protein [Novosphingobium sp.]|jgi:type 1 fimbria pilin|uniref:hypothetical protein n=1 Tax=Novosphingobium sp. TaxID=1874826 RepID=UPI002FE08704
MMKFFRWILTCVAMFASGAVLADGSTGSIQIKTIVVEPSGTWLEVANVVNPDSCGSTQRLKLVEAAGVTDRMYAAALASKSARTPVSLWLSGCTNTPWGYTAPIVYSITILD